MSGFDLDRRRLLQGGAAAAAMLTGDQLFNFAKAWAQTSQWKPEPGAKLTVMRWKRFVESEDAAFNEMVAAFSKATGTEMNVFSESFEDEVPKASVAANTGAGMDMVWGTHTLPQLFPDKVVYMNDVADYLGKKYGGWTDAAMKTVTLNNNWLGIPVATAGGALTYRKSATDKAGFSKFPTDFPGFLELCKALKKNNTPAGFALGHATGDANGWLHWALWGHGAYTVDKDDKVIINSPETAKALDYVKALSDTFIPGVASWNDSSNNKAFLSGELFLTLNGISIYLSAKDDPKMKDLAEDIYHSTLPVGPIGKPAELHLATPIFAFKFTKYPNAAKAFTAFMLEKEQFDKWLIASRGYLTQTLNAYEANPVWTADPKSAPYAVTSKRTLPASGIGHPGEKAAQAIADFIVVDMFASYCSGQADAKTAMSNAERLLKRIYRT